MFSLPLSFSLGLPRSLPPTLIFSLSDSHSAGVSRPSRIREYFFPSSPFSPSLSRPPCSSRRSFFYLYSSCSLSSPFLLLSVSLSFSRPETFPQTPLRRHSRLVYPPTSIRIPVACYIMAYQLFCQFPVRAPDEWDFFLCFFYYFTRAVEIIGPSLAVSRRCVCVYILYNISPRAR